MLGIIGAMESEVAILKERMSDVSVVTKASMQFYKGKLQGVDVVIVKCGIGKVNAAICTQILIDEFGITGIINTGVAGSLKNEINIGDIVISSDALEHDMNVKSLGYGRGTIPDMETSIFKADERLITIAETCCKELTDINVYKGRVVSGDIFVSRKKTKEKLAARFDGYCTEMEGGAIAHCAYLNDVPFVVIRSISDKADDSASMNYSEFETMAIKNSVKLIEDIVNQEKTVD